MAWESLAVGRTALKASRMPAVPRYEFLDLNEDYRLHHSYYKGVGPALHGLLITTK